MLENKGLVDLLIFILLIFIIISFHVSHVYDIPFSPVLIYFPKNYLFFLYSYKCSKVLHSILILAQCLVHFPVQQPLTKTTSKVVKRTKKRDVWNRVTSSHSELLNTGTHIAVGATLERNRSGQRLHFISFHKFLILLWLLRIGL